MSHGYLFEQMAEEGEGDVKCEQGSFLVYVVFPRHGCFSVRETTRKLKAAKNQPEWMGGHGK